MRAPATVARVAGAAVLLFGVAFLPVLHLRDAYSAVFRTQASMVLGFRSDRHAVEFKPQADLSSDNDVVIVIASKGDPRALTVGIKSLFAFIPTALFTALVSVTPVRGSSRLKAFFLGGLLIEAYVLCGVALTLLRAWTVHAQQCRHYHASHFVRSGWWEALDLFDAVLTRSPSLNIVVAIFAWICVSHRSLGGLPFSHVLVDGTRASPQPAQRADH